MACAVDPNENLSKAEWRIREAAGRGAQIVCVQELFRSQYFCREENCDLFDLAEPIPGPTSESFCRLARELGIVIVGSVFERRTALSSARGEPIPGPTSESFCRLARELGIVIVGSVFERRTAGVY